MKSVAKSLGTLHKKSIYLMLQWEKSAAAIGLALLFYLYSLVSVAKDAYCRDDKDDTEYYL
jgi:hypothetical protein